MKTAQILLKILTERVPPFGTGKHAITLTDDTLTLSLSVGGGWTPVTFDDADFEKTPEALAEEIVSGLKAGA